MKKILSLVLTLGLLASCFSGCTPKDQEPELNLNIQNDNVRNWYEVFVYSFYDSNNDGVGDLKGVTQKLDYIKDMGFNGIWLMPIHPSPTYHKYDVKDYYAIDPQYGTLADLDELIIQAHARGIKVILDLVVNHTSNEHPWFREACTYITQNGAPGGKYGEYYNFRVGNQAQYSQVTGTNYYYEARFWSGMPDLNLNSEAVRTEIRNIMDFYLLQHNVDGFRLDAVTSYYTGNVQGNVDFLAWLNREAKAIKPDCYIVGEAWEGSDYQIGRYYESGVDSFFLFTGAQATGTISMAVRQNHGAGVGKLMLSLQDSYKKGTLAPFLGNHDTMRPGSFMPGEENLKMAAGVMAMMNGNVFVYYGEEIGMISKNGSSSDPAKRIAMKWSPKSVYPGWCYQTPQGIAVDETSYYYPSVEEQMDDPNSILNYYKKAMLLRNCFPAIARGQVEYFPDGQNSYVCVLRKTWNGDSVVIVMNLDSFAQTVTLDTQALGISGLAGQLLVDTKTSVSYDGKGTVVMPAQSIAIFR